VAGADTNPYLAFAASLASGYLGIEEELTPTEPLKGSAYELEISLPRDIRSALKLLKRSTTFKQHLGKEFVQLYMAVKELELETFSRVISPWEREHLLLKV
jgi:glutamine synthetase